MGLWASGHSSPAPRSRTETHIHAVSGRHPGPPQEHRRAPGCEGPPGGAGPTLTPRCCTGLSWPLGSQDQGRTHQTGPETRVPGLILPGRQSASREPCGPREEGGSPKENRDGSVDANRQGQLTSPVSRQSGHGGVVGGVVRGCGRGCSQGVWSAAPELPGRHCSVPLIPRKAPAGELSSPFSGVVAPHFLIAWLQISPPEKKAEWASVQPQILVLWEPIKMC